MPAVRAHLRIHGRVQGVFFRASAHGEARALGLTGWVRNCPNGAVEIVVEGEQARVDRFVTWCHSGPPGAHVTDVAATGSSATGEFSSFSVT